MMKKASIAWMILFSCALASCAIEDSDGIITSVRITFNSTGLSTWIRLSNAVDVPLDEEDATLIMVECSCGCVGDLIREGEYWQYSDKESPGCFIRIHVRTGDVECSS
ncbi:MAG: hypothetical protein ACP5G0_03355 [Desulfomonilia bacterium]